jgi:menaquinone-dependent protoporphyrinogen oxidase
MMDIKVLVTYDSKHGSTEEIAARIAEVLEEARLETEPLPVHEVRDLSSYQAVVLGSAVYMGQWRKNAATFLKKHQEELAGLDVWLFSSGPTGEGEPSKILDGWTFPESLKAVAEYIKPRQTALFHGDLNRDELNFMERFAVDRVKAPLGDYRDWGRIAEWARSIAIFLSESKPDSSEYGY